MSHDPAGLLALRQRPKGRVVMRQSWHNLLFLHQRVPLNTLAVRLPEGLELDLFDGEAWVGVVPFYMRKVRPIPFPAVPGISDFLECNIRTYVVGPDGPGVWFDALDCNQPLAVEVARHFFKLPYFHSLMKSDRDEKGVVDYQCDRCGEGEAGRFRFMYQPEGAERAVQALPGSQEFFFLERYLLYSFDAKRKQLYSGRVWHMPYAYCGATLDVCDDSLLAQTLGVATDGGFEHVCFSPGVDVEVFALNACH